MSFVLETTRSVLQWKCSAAGRAMLRTAAGQFSIEHFGLRLKNDFISIEESSFPIAELVWGFEGFQVVQCVLWDESACAQGGRLLGGGLRRFLQR